MLPDWLKAELDRVMAEPDWNISTAYSCLFGVSESVLALIACGATVDAKRRHAEIMAGKDYVDAAANERWNKSRSAA